MGFLDKLFRRARQEAPDVAAEHGDKVVEGVHKAGDFADEKTGGRHSEQIDTAETKVEDAVEKLADEKADEPAPPSEAPPR
jgi:hypothetical protein